VTLCANRARACPISETDGVRGLTALCAEAGQNKPIRAAHSLDQPQNSRHAASEVSSLESCIESFGRAYDR
jgi:hypothetical protein